MSACHPSGPSNAAYACLVLSAFEPNALPETQCMPVHASRFLFKIAPVQGERQLRSTSHQGERLVLLLLFVWLWFFVGFFGVLVVGVVLWFGLPGRFSGTCPSSAIVCDSLARS